MGYARGSTGISRLLAVPGRARARLVAATLLAFALRALIPLGFMPASDGSLSVMLCPAGLPAGLLESQSVRTAMPMAGGAGMAMPAHQQHGHGLMDVAYCVYTTGFSSAPPPLLLAALLLLLSCVVVITVAVLAPAGIRLVHLPQARAPPAAV